MSRIPRLLMGGILPDDAFPDAIAVKRLLDKDKERIAILFMNKAVTSLDDHAPSMIGVELAFFSLAMLRRFGVLFVNGGVSGLDSSVEHSIKRKAKTIISTYYARCSELKQSIDMFVNIWRRTIYACNGFFPFNRGVYENLVGNNTHRSILDVMTMELMPLVYSRVQNMILTHSNDSVFRLMAWLLPCLMDEIDLSITSGTIDPRRLFTLEDEVWIYSIVQKGLAMPGNHTATLVASMNDILETLVSPFYDPKISRDSASRHASAFFIEMRVLRPVPIKGSPFEFTEWLASVWGTENSGGIMELKVAPDTPQEVRIQRGIFTNMLRNMINNSSSALIQDTLPTSTKWSSPVDVLFRKHYRYFATGRTWNPFFRYDMLKGLLEKAQRT